MDEDHVSVRVASMQRSSKKAQLVLQGGEKPE